MRYEGEHLLIGQLGHFFAVLSLVASLAAVYAYARAASLGASPLAAGWRRIGRIAFITDAVSVLLVFVLLYLIIYNHWFEYRYSCSGRSGTPSWGWSSCVARGHGRRP
jgi:cytochrome c-type biogenesis protein CcmF